MNSSRFRFCAVLLANLTGATALLAADPPPTTPAPPPGPLPPAVTEATGPTRVNGPDRRGGDRNFDRNERAAFQGRGPTVGLGLDEKQRELYREATQKEGEEIRKLEEKLRAAQKELLHTVLAEKYDEKNVREKADAVSKLQTEITLLRSKALAAVAPTLRPEQREQLENSPLGAAMLNSAFGGFGGFRGGPGGPGGYGGGSGGPGGPDGGFRGGGRGGDGQAQPGGEQLTDGNGRRGGDRRRPPPPSQPQPPQ